MLNLIYSLNGPANEFIGSFFHTTYLLMPVGEFGGMFWRMLQVILATAFVALLAYYSIKMMGMARGRRGWRGGNLSVLDSIAVGQQSMVQLVRVGDKYLAIGVTKERVTLLAELDESQLELPEVSELGAAVPFSNVLSRFLPPKDSDGSDDTNREQDEQR